MLDLDSASCEIKELVYSRFDFGVKYQFGRSLIRNNPTVASFSLYRDHLEIWNSFYEDIPRKTSFGDFVASYLNVLRGFAEGRSFPPVQASNGALVNGIHRLAACCLFNASSLNVEYINSPYRYGSDFFKTYCNPKTNRTFNRRLFTRMGLSLCQVAPTSAFVLHPKALLKDNGKYALDLLTASSQVLFKYRFQINPFSAPLLYIQLYGLQQWLSPDLGSGQLLSSLYSKIFSCLDSNSGNQNVQIIFTRPLQSDAILEIKNKIRSYYSIGNDSIHSTDNAGEAQDLAYALMTSKDCWAFMRFLLIQSPSTLRLINDYRSVNKYAIFIYCQHSKNRLRLLKVQDGEPISADLATSSKGIWLHGSYISLEQAIHLPVTQ